MTATESVHETVTTVRSIDGDSLLSQHMLERIVAAVLAGLEEQARRRRYEDAQRTSDGQPTPDGRLKGITFNVVVDEDDD